MQMTSSGPRRSISAHAGRSLRVWIYLLVIGGLACTVLLFSISTPPAERAYQRGVRLLSEGQTDRAVAQLELAIKLNPAFEPAWHALLQARPTPAVCRRFAMQLPELFDTLQPVEDPKLLVRGRGWDVNQWNKSLEIYTGVIRRLPAQGADPDATLIRLDFQGRQHVANAWRAVSKLREGLHRSLRTPISPSSLRPLATYELDKAMRLMRDLDDNFTSPERWLHVLQTIDDARKAQAVGLAKLKQAAAQAPQFVPSQLTLAYLDIARGGGQAAEARCQRLLATLRGRRELPGELRLRYCLARAIELKGDYHGAAAEIRRILVRKPRNTQAMLRLGALYLKCGRTQDADHIADQLLEQSAMDPRPSYIKGVAALRSGDPETAVSQLTTAYRHFPYDLDIHYSLAWAKHAAGRHASAASEFVKVAASTPDAGWPLAAAAASALAGRLGRPASEAADAILAEPRWLEAHPELQEYALRFRTAAAALQARHEMADAAASELLDAVRDKHPHDVANYLAAGVWAGQAYVSADADLKLKPAHLAYFAAAAKDDPAAAYCHAFLFAAGGQVVQARAVLETVTQNRPAYTLAALHLARLYLLDGKTERAAAVLRATGRADESADVARALAVIDALQGVTIARAAADPQAETDGAGVVGPHLAFFAMAMHESAPDFAQRVLLLDPVDPVTYDILRLTYPHIRKRGLKGVAIAIAADKTKNTGVAIQRALAIYQAGRNRMFRLVIGRFWDDAPLDL